MRSTRLSLRERFSLKRFFQGEKPGPEPIELSHRRIFILPTKAGLLCGATLATMLLASIIYNNNPGFILTFLLASIALVSILHSFRSLKGLHVSLERSEPVFAGESAIIGMRIDNPSAWPRLNLEASREGQEPVSGCLAEFSTNTLELPVKTSRRGLLNPGTVTLASRYPLGLFRAWSPLNFCQSILVYPKPADQPVSEQIHSSSQARPRMPMQDSDEFSGLDEYRPGDSLRKIHWKSYAKGQGLMTKQFSGEQSTEIWFDLDTTPGANLEERLSRICRGILDAENAGLHYGLKLSGLIKNPDRGQVHCNECLKALALY